MSRDEIRSRENMNPIEDGTGADFLVPLNMGKAPIKIEDSPESDAEFGARKSLIEILQATIRRMAGRLAIKAVKKAKEAASSQEPEILSQWLDGGMRMENEDIVSEALDPVIEALRDPAIGALRKSREPRDHVGEFFELMRASLSVISDGNSRNEIAGEAVTELSSRWLGDN